MRFCSFNLADLHEAKNHGGFENFLKFEIILFKQLKNELVKTGIKYKKRS